MHINRNVLTDVQHFPFPYFFSRSTLLAVKFSDIEMLSPLSFFLLKNTFCQVRKICKPNYYWLILFPPAPCIVTCFLWIFKTLPPCQTTIILEFLRDFHSFWKYCKKKCKVVLYALLKRSLPPFTHLFAF